MDITGANDNGTGESLRESAFKGSAAPGLRPDISKTAFTPTGDGFEQKLFQLIGSDTMPDMSFYVQRREIPFTRHGKTYEGHSETVYWLGSQLEDKAEIEQDGAYSLRPVDELCALFDLPAGAPVFNDVLIGPLSVHAMNEIIELQHARMLGDGHEAAVCRDMLDRLWNDEAPAPAPAQGENVIPFRPR